MSVTRSAYRHIIRLISRASRGIENADDFCFALFGILLNRSDFAAAGYGNDVRAIVRSCFDRPTIPDDPRDSVSARLASSFVVLRKLHEVENSDVWQLAWQRRKGLLNPKTSVSSTSRDAQADSSDPIVPSELVTFSKQVRKRHMKVPRSPEAPPATRNDEAKSRAVQGSIDSVVLKGSGTEIAEVRAAKDNHNIVVGDATIFIERPKMHRVQKYTRHVVLCRERETIPPYSYLLPPEPMYNVSIRHDFPFHFMNDAIICLAASSALLKNQTAGGAREDAAVHDKISSSSGMIGLPSDTRADLIGLGKCVFSPHHDHSRFYSTSPRSLNEVWGLLQTIPTRTVKRTDFAEVEVYTRYVCSTQSPAEASTQVKQDGCLHGDGGRSDTEVIASNFPDHARAEKSTLTSASQQHLFLYYVFIRILDPRTGDNPRQWHAQILSHHLAVFDPARGAVVEMVRPGLMGNFPLLAPGESHAFESGTSIFGTDGILRGTIQLNAFNEHGEIRILDIALAPTRLSVSVKEALSSKKKVTDERPSLERQRNRYGLA